MVALGTENELEFVARAFREVVGPPEARLEGRFASTRKCTGLFEPRRAGDRTVSVVRVVGCLHMAGFRLCLHVVLRFVMMMRLHDPLGPRPWGKHPMPPLVDSAEHSPWKIQPTQLQRTVFEPGWDDSPPRIRWLTGSGMLTALSACCRRGAARVYRRPRSKAMMPKDSPKGVEFHSPSFPVASPAQRQHPRPMAALSYAPGDSAPVARLERAVCRLPPAPHRPRPRGQPSPRLKRVIASSRARSSAVCSATSRSRLALSCRTFFANRRAVARILPRGSLDATRLACATFPRVEYLTGPRPRLGTAVTNRDACLSGGLVGAADACNRLVLTNRRCDSIRDRTGWGLCSAIG